MAALLARVAVLQLIKFGSTEIAASTELRIQTKQPITIGIIIAARTVSDKFFFIQK